MVEISVEMLKFLKFLTLLPAIGMAIMTIFGWMIILNDDLSDKSLIRLVAIGTVGTILLSIIFSCLPSLPSVPNV